jgi:preprotein translocase subunit YajC
VVLAVLYVAFVRPQWRVVRDYKAMIRLLKPRDLIVTEGGLYGHISDILNDKDIVVEFAPALKIKMRRQAVSEVVASAPQNDASPPPKAEGLMA